MNQPFSMTMNVKDNVLTIIFPDAALLTSFINCCIEKQILGQPIMETVQ